MGLVPTVESLNLKGLTIAPETVKALLDVTPADWTGDLAAQRAFFDQIGDRLPPALRDEQNRFAKRLGLN